MSKILCFFGIHIYIKDYLVDNVELKYYNKHIRKCIDCKKILLRDIREGDYIK